MNELISEDSALQTVTTDCERAYQSIITALKIAESHWPVTQQFLGVMLHTAKEHCDSAHETLIYALEHSELSYVKRRQIRAALVQLTQMLEILNYHRR